MKMKQIALMIGVLVLSCDYALGDNTAYGEGIPNLLLCIFILTTFLV